MESARRAASDGLVLGSPGPRGKWFRPLSGFAAFSFFLLSRAPQTWMAGSSGRISSGSPAGESPNDLVQWSGEVRILYEQDVGHSIFRVVQSTNSRILPLRPTIV